ncbi:MAG: hypothetical protein LBV69_04520 [Bacteroidales bacterium]|jgi:hypothetical protein|nr:hypothetical protein [Bacteroidales bacterium]
MAIKENCYFDWELNTTEYPQFSNSSVIFFKNNAIDIVIILEATKIQEQLEFFKKNL